MQAMTSNNVVLRTRPAVHTFRPCCVVSYNVSSYGITMANLVHQFPMGQWRVKCTQQTYILSNVVVF